MVPIPTTFIKEAGEGFEPSTSSITGSLTLPSRKMRATGLRYPALIVFWYLDAEVFLALVIDGCATFVRT